MAPNPTVTRDTEERSLVPIAQVTDYLPTLLLMCQDHERLPHYTRKYKLPLLHSAFLYNPLNIAT
jgi:hypothetical protein